MRITPQILAALRVGLALTQAELAQRLGVSQSTVCLWEAGRRRPRRRSAARILRFMEEIENVEHDR